MPHILSDAPYDPHNRDSILRYAQRLIGKTVREIVSDQSREVTMRNKGAIGSIIEHDYFRIESNNEHVPDFEDVGIELKTTMMVKRNDGRLVPKERLSLSMINYMEVIHETFEQSILGKCNEMLIIFLEYLEDVSPLDFRILRVTLCEFTEEDKRILSNDWDKIVDLVKMGRAEELSSSLTLYLEAASKGPGKGKGMRQQPFSAVLAKPRGFALKPGFVKRIWEGIDEEDILIKDPTDWDFELTFEDYVLQKFIPYRGRSIENLLDMFDIPDVSDKGKFARVARCMMGVSGRTVDEFDKADIVMKTIRVKPNGVPKESMSFPYFRFEDIADGDWDDSDFHRTLDKKFLFIVYDIMGDETVFDGAYFWSISPEDMSEAERVWMLTKERIKAGQLDSLPRSKESSVAHVRPHARNKNDRYLGRDGTWYEKKCFWLNAKFLGRVISDLREGRL